MSNSNRYSGINFPPYRFQEFPKWVDLPDGKRVLVQNNAELLDRIATAGRPPKPSAVEAERDELVRLADEQRQKVEGLEKELETLRNAQDAQGAQGAAKATAPATASGVK